jgi:DNA-binding transcriptional regulator LsrR (DeoR family)
MIIVVNTVNENGIKTVLDLKKRNMSSSLLSLTSQGIVQVRMSSAVEESYEYLVKEIFVRMPISIFLNETALLHQFNIKILLSCVYK